MKKSLGTDPSSHRLTEAARRAIAQLLPYSLGERILLADDAERRGLERQPESRICLMNLGPREPMARHPRALEANPRVSTAVGAWAVNLCLTALDSRSRKCTLGCDNGSRLTYQQTSRRGPCIWQSSPLLSVSYFPEETRRGRPELGFVIALSGYPGVHVVGPESI